MKKVVISGYFNPLHGGHLDMIEAAKKMGDYLIVVVNNDIQQFFKKGKIILDESNRVRLMKALRDVDEVVLSIDNYQLESGEIPIVKTLEMIAIDNNNDEIIFANGGDRDSEKSIPESDICNKYGIAMVFGVGGFTKYDSSTRINNEIDLSEKDKADE